jgi:hypothetical protein
MYPIQKKRPALIGKWPITPFARHDDTSLAVENDSQYNDSHEWRPDMTTDTPASAPGLIAVNAAKVLDTTRRAWSDAAVHAQTQAETTKDAKRRPPRASQAKKRIVPRRSRWPSLVAALHYWSPKPL